MDALYGSYEGYLAHNQQFGIDNYGSYEAMPGYAGSYIAPQGYGYGSGYGYAAPAGYGAAAAGYGSGFWPQQVPRRHVADIRGVGIAFGKAPYRSKASLAIRKIYPGSSAHRARILERGDVLVSVNGVDVTMHSLGVLRTIIPGPAFTPIRLGFVRRDYKRFEVDLIRDYKGNFSSGFIPAPAPRPVPMIWEQPAVQYIQQPVSYIQQPQVTYVQTTQPQYVQTQYVETVQDPGHIEVKGTQV